MIQEGNFLISIITMPLKNKVFKKDLIIRKNMTQRSNTPQKDIRKPIFPTGSHGQKEKNLLSLICKKI